MSIERICNEPARGNVLNVHALTLKLSGNRMCKSNRPKATEIEYSYQSILLMYVSGDN